MSQFILLQGQKFVADLQPDGRIKWPEASQVFNSPSAWAIYCKKLVNPSKKSGCGWASVSETTAQLSLSFWHAVNQAQFFYYTLLYVVLVSCFFIGLQLILEINATYTLVSYLLADNWLICRMYTQCMILNSNSNSGSLRQCVCCYFLQNNV